MFPYSHHKREYYTVQANSSDDSHLEAKTKIWVIWRQWYKHGWGVLTSCTILSCWGDLADLVFCKHSGPLSFQIRIPGYTAGYHKPDSCSESVSVESEIS